MKKLSILAILLVSVLAFSCGDDDEPAIKCLKCTVVELGCVGEVIDPDNPDLGTYDEATLKGLFDGFEISAPGTCTFE